MARRWCGGHLSPVLCVAASAEAEGLLASGSEGGEVTVWTQDGAVLSRLRLAGGADVTCAAFSPAAPGLLYVSHGGSVSALDPRRLTAPTEELAGLAEDEINVLALDEAGGALATADDSGAVRVLEVPSGRVTRTLRRHTNICSSVCFRPQRPHTLVSAGLDMQVMLWNLHKTRPLWAVNLQDVSEEVGEEEEGNAGRLFNPPLVHCVSVATCGNVLACAAEDGRVHLMRVGVGSRLEQQGALKAHASGASQAHFLSFLPHPYWLATGGNDGRVALWDVGQEPAVAGAHTKGMQLVTRPRRKPKARPKAKLQAQARALPEEEEGNEALEEEEGSEKEGSPGEPAGGSAQSLESGPRFCFSHGDKVNWVCPAMLKGEPSLVVADQSSSLTLYSLAGL